MKILMNQRELPPSTKPWKINFLGTTVVFINEEHEPLFLVKDQLFKMQLRKGALSDAKPE